VTPWYASYNVAFTILTQTLYPNIIQRAKVLTDYGQFDYRSDVVCQHAVAVSGRPSCSPFNQYHWSIPLLLSYQSTRFGAAKVTLVGVDISRIASVSVRSATGIELEARQMITTIEETTRRRQSQKRSLPLKMWMETVMGALFLLMNVSLVVATSGRCNNPALGCCLGSGT
jgi:hypothetical protein